jgi:hypothetical protein
MARNSDWMDKLINAVETAQLIEFNYGVHDCCLWAAHCVDEMCGTEHVKAILERFHYTDEASADAILAAGGGLETLVTEFLGESVGRRMAAPGDVVLAKDMEDSYIIGVVVGHGVVAPAKGGGLVSLPYRSILKTWKV